jgi:hypothetical protein
MYCKLNTWSDVKSFRCLDYTLSLVLSSRSICSCVLWVMLAAACVRWVRTQFWIVMDYITSYITRLEDRHVGRHVIYFNKLLSSAADLLLGSWVRIPLRAWIFVCCVCCVGNGLWYGLITHSEEPYWVCVCVSNCVCSRNNSELA